MTAILGLFATVCALALLWCVLHPAERRTPGWTLIWCIYAVLVFTMSAFRVGGSDWENYDSLYDLVRGSGSVSEAVETNFVIEPGYVALNYLFGSQFDTRRALVVFESAANALAILLLILRTRGGPVLLVWLFPLQFSNILGVRQTFAASVLIVALLATKRLTRYTIAALSSLLHLSAAFLLAAHLIRFTRFTVGRLLLGLAALGTLGLVMQFMLAEKIDNYLQSASELTGLSANEVVVGKVSTFALIGSIAVVARLGTSAVDRQRGLAPLLALALLLTLGAYASPALIRVTTPIELVLAWYCADSISGVVEFRLRAALTGILIAVAALKMFKIATQFGDVYSVCFFCGG